MIKIKEGYKTLQFKVEQINVTAVSEQFKIIAKNKTIVLESNRPFFRNKNLKHRHPDWKLVEGKLAYAGAIEKLATIAPFSNRRISGSFPKFPIKITLLTLPAILYLETQIYKIESHLLDYSL